MEQSDPYQARLVAKDNDVLPAHEGTPLKGSDLVPPGEFEPAHTV